ncbi:DMT family transporter [Streptomyces zhihengii]|uniref:DMT family transporter n=1 Tax=Streptomyces zhihengii TaxID=1818004 RepID=A0ABS2UKG8_9ACTN|nr:DMT family transporter [Streptomyces zhihengii]MBM9618021.1 DMT family transporter [Streptomyces zhihengii]
MNGLVVAVLLSLLSAVGYAFAAVTQSRLAAAAAQGGGGPRSLAAQPLWWWAVGLNGAGALAHVGALHYGPLTLVQPLGALTLVAALPLAARRDRRRVARGEWRGALCTLAGLVGLISVTGPAAPGDALTVRESLTVAVASGLLIAVLARGRGLGHATASGVASGVASALTQTVTAALAGELPGGATAWWATALLSALVAALSVGGLLLSQRAYRGGLAAPLALVNLSNPAVAAVIGVALLGETFRAGAWGWLIAAASAALAARGVILLTGAVPPARVTQATALVTDGTVTGAPAAGPPPAAPSRGVHRSRCRARHRDAEGRRAGRALSRPGAGSRTMRAVLTAQPPATGSPRVPGAYLILPSRRPRKAEKKPSAAATR